MPPEAEEFYRLFALYVTASSAAARTAAWSVCVEYLAKNPRAYSYLGGKLTTELLVAVERVLLRALAAKGVQRGIQATSRPVMRVFVARLAANVALGPKIPLPQAQVALTIGIALVTAGQAFAETKDAESHLPKYQEYLVLYTQRIASIVRQKPQIANRLAEPQTFDQWVEENR